MKIYTKTGDKGQTSLASGSRVQKNDPRVVAYGEVDSLNSWVGLLITQLQFPQTNLRQKNSMSELVKSLTIIQNQLFSLGSEVSCDTLEAARRIQSPISIDDIKRLEDEMDQMSEGLPPLKNFILPGGSHCAAFAHMCRTHTRTSERYIIAVDGLRDEIQIYLNRLSDYFFVAARFINFNLSVEDVCWKNL